ncbi:hypothetical protein AgCh_025319 [Apium graveolens]
MGRITIFRDMIGVIKDKASLSKATILSKSNLHLAVLRATSHAPSTTPQDHHLSTLLSAGDGSRATASTLIESLMDRLHRTGNSIVALKCLLTIHHIIKRGPFILQDQLSIFPATGGHNYLKLSGFRDGTTATTWLLSAYVRWYARYLETLISTSRVLGFFLGSCLSKVEKEKQVDGVSSMMNDDLIRDVDSLILVIEEFCKVPDGSLSLEGNKLLHELVGLVENDYLLCVNEIIFRLSEFKERLGHLSFGESFELVCILKRLNECKERLLGSFIITEQSMGGMLWSLIEELESRVGMKEEGKFLTKENKERYTESARFGERVLTSSDSVKFSSSRFSFNRRNSFNLLDSTV